LIEIKIILGYKSIGQRDEKGTTSFGGINSYEFGLLIMRCITAHL